MTPHLLLIEDDEAAAYLTLKVFKACGFNAWIDVVQDGIEAMRYLSCQGPYADRQSGNPSLILLDLKLPNLDGFEVLKQIRTTPSLSSIPVFILSASGADEDINRSNLLGISKYIVKPLDMHEFCPEAKKVFGPPKASFQ
jgi:CheY-like chemotaxis protein